MSDLMIIDTRGRAAGAALREAAARRPLGVRSATTSPAATHPRRHGRRMAFRPVIIVAFVVLLVAALFALTNRDPQPAQPSSPKDLRYIVTDLGQFWTVEGARDGGGVDNNPLPGYFGTLYGTLGDPTRPGMLLTWVDTESTNSAPFDDDGFTSLVGAANLERFEVAGLPAGCGERPTGETMCKVETPNGFVATLSLGVSHDELTTMLATVRHDGTQAGIDPTSLPASIGEVISGPLGSVVRTDDVFSAAASAVRWTNSNGNQVTVTVAHDDGTRLTRRAVEPGWEPVSIGDTAGYRLDAAANVSKLMWSDDGRTFTVEAVLGSNQSETAADLAMQFATTLHPASADEWASLPEWKVDEITPETTALESPLETNASTTSTPTSAPSNEATVDIEVGLDRVAQFGGEMRVRNTGERVADDQYIVGFAIDTFQIRGDAGSGSFRVTTEPVVQVPPTTELRGAYVVTTVDGELVVTGQDGTRYHATPEAIFDGSDVRFAMVNLPVDIVGAQFVAPDGSVLAELPGLG